MKASLIIAIYNNTPFLKVILDSLHFQTEKDFEIIITEDGEDPSVKEFINQYPFEQPWKHLTQKDEGWRKNKALNMAIRSVQSDWLIFIDGDCVLHKKFIEMHIRFADSNTILAGKRVVLNDKSSHYLLNDKLNIPRIQRYLLTRFFFTKTKIRHFEESFFISPNGFLGFIPKRRKLNNLLGCNMSFSKQAIYDINGFDEDYILPAVGEDADLTWRFIGLGYKIKSIRNMAIVYHLNHPRNWINQDENLEKCRKKQIEKAYICKNGLIKLNC